MRDKILAYVKSQEQPFGGVVDIPHKPPSAILTAGLIPTLIAHEERDFAQRCATYLVACQLGSGAWVNHHGEIKPFDIAYIGRHLNIAYTAFDDEFYEAAADRAWDYLIGEGWGADPMKYVIDAAAVGGDYLVEYLTKHIERTHNLMIVAESMKARKQRKDRRVLIELAKRNIRPDGLLALTTDGNGSDIAATAMLGLLEPSMAKGMIQAIEPWVNADGSLPVIAGTTDKSAWVSKHVLDLYKAAE